MTTTSGRQGLHASHRRNHVRRQPRDVVFDAVLYLICFLLLILILYPLWFIVIASFSDPSAVAGGHVWFVPVGFTLDGYEELLNQPNVWVGYRNTILYTVTGTLFGLAVNIPAAYALSRRDLWGRKALMGLFVFTMFFSGGLIPIFLTVQELGLYNSFWVMVVPFSVSAYNVIEPAPSLRPACRPICGTRPRSTAAATCASSLRLLCPFPRRWSPSSPCGRRWASGIVTSTP